MNLKQISFFSSTVFSGIFYNVLYIGIIVGIMYGGFYFIKFLNGFGVPFTQYFLDNPKLIIILVLGPVGIFYTYKSIRKESADFCTLKSTISKKLNSRLSFQNEYKDILTKLEIRSSYIEYTFIENNDISLRFYDNNFIDIKIINVFAHYFKVCSKDPTTAQFNLLNVNDETSDLKFIKKIFSIRPKILDESQINLVIDIIELFSDVYTIKLNENGLFIYLKIDFDEKNWKQIDDYLNDVEFIPSVLRNNKMYSKALEPLK